MARIRDPLADPAPLIRRVYAYVAYRIGHGPEAEDATSEVFERALRYRSSYDAEKGEPLSWLLGIARRVVSESLAASAPDPAPPLPGPIAEGVETEAIQRLGLRAALSRLSDRERDLIALRYGADLKASQIARLLGSTPGAVEVALHRARERLRGELERESAKAASPGSAVASESAQPELLL